MDALKGLDLEYFIITLNERMLSLYSALLVKQIQE